MQSTAPPSAQIGVGLQGNIHGGQQPIAGASVYLFAAGSTGYGGKGIAAGDGTSGSTDNRSLSLLTSSVTTNNPGRSGHDSNGYYVTSDGSGAFSIKNDYSCTAGQQLYIYAVGGNPGAGTNSAAGLLAAIGECTTLTTSSYIWVNEVSTVAASYALAGFASDATHISSSGTTLAKVGLANAFKNAGNIVGLSTGSAVQTTGNLTAPYKQVNSLANILAACVNTTGKTSSPCSTLFGAATSTGAAGGTAAADTATAAIYIAQNPAANVHTLWTIPPPAVPFGPALGSEPTDWIVALAFTGGGMNSPFTVAIDGSGNAWVSNENGKSISGFSSLGVDLSTGSGFADPATSVPRALAIDAFNNIWVAAGATPGHLSEFSPTGALTASYASFDGTNQGAEYAAFDALGYLWMTHAANYVSKFLTLNSTGASYPITGLNSLGIALDQSSNVWVSNYASGGYVGELEYPGVIGTQATNGLSYPKAVAFDHSGNLWVMDSFVTTTGLSKFNSSGTLLASTTSGGLKQPTGLAIDSAGYVWLGNSSTGGISEFDPSATPITSTAAFTGGLSISCEGIAIDGSGNIWTTSGNNLIEFIGAASPVVTPLVSNISIPAYGKPASKP